MGFSFRPDPPTEQEWLTGEPETRVVNYALSLSLNPRKFNLAKVAQFRHTWGALDERGRHFLEVVETRADDADGERLNANYAAIREAFDYLYRAAFERGGLEAIRAVRIPDLHEVFGNPFRPVTLDPRWQTETVFALASGIYADRAFDRMPILADALEEAGCDNTDILTHSRGDGPHVRGCWVVDLLLGKS